MNEQLSGVRWGYVLPAGLATPIITQMALTGVTALAPALIAHSGAWLVAIWTILWAGICAVLVGLKVPARDAVRHGLLSGLIAALFGLIMYGWFGIGALGLFAFTVGAGMVGGALARREHAAGW